jgi:hypothetical protein
MSNRRRQAAPAASEPEITPKPPYPTHWVQGQLLDLRKFTDGSARATLLGEEYDPITDNAVHFDSLYAAQQFISTWYARETQHR